MKKIIYLTILTIVIFSCQKLEILEHSNPLDDGSPFVSTTKSDFITSTTAELSGEIIDIGDDSITYFGHCWSNSNNPTIEDSVNIDNNYSSSKYVIVALDLSPSKKYYFRAFATNSIGTSYGDILSFSTNDAIPPTVNTIGHNNITESTVYLDGEIITEGSLPIIQHGHCWSISPNPTIDDSVTTKDANGVGSFTSNISNLIESTKYYYRAYATTTSETTVYGTEESFTTYGPTYLQTYNCESFEGVFYSDSYYWDFDHYVGGPWNILASGGYSGGCFNMPIGSAASSGSTGYVDYVWSSNYDGYIELWFYTSNGSASSPTISIDGVSFVNPYIVVDSVLLGGETWRKLRTERILSSSDTIRFGWWTPSNTLNQKIDEVEIWEYK